MRCIVLYAFIYHCGYTLSTINSNGRKLRNAKLWIIIKFSEDLEHYAENHITNDWLMSHRAMAISHKKEISYFHTVLFYKRLFTRVSINSFKLRVVIVVDYGDLISLWGFIEIEMLWHAKHKYASNLFCSIGNWEFCKISSPHRTTVKSIIFIIN